jgi:hypothetical protein
MTNVAKWYWVASAVALLWALMGCFAYWSQVTMSAADLAQLPQSQQDIWKAMPKWVIGAYAIAVWSALLGVIGLLLRRRWARPLLLLSIAGIIGQFGWTFLATDLLRAQGMSAAAFPLFILLAGLAMLWLATTAAARGWLR